MRGNRWSPDCSPWNLYYKSKWSWFVVLTLPSLCHLLTLPHIFQILVCPPVIILLLWINPKLLSFAACSSFSGHVLVLGLKPLTPLEWGQTTLESVLSPLLFSFFCVGYFFINFLILTWGHVYIGFREIERKKTSMWERNIHRSVAQLPPRCAWMESNPQPRHVPWLEVEPATFRKQDDTPPSCATRPGLCVLFLNLTLCETLP